MFYWSNLYIINNFLRHINKEFEYTIIGSGPASLTLALELEENKIPCLILEAGEFENKEKYKKKFNKEIKLDQIGILF